MTRLGCWPALSQVGVFWPDTSISFLSVAVCCVSCFLWLIMGHTHQCLGPLGFSSEVGVPWACQRSC